MTASHFSVFDALFRISPKGEILPNLASEVPNQANGGISADGLNWRIRLRDKVLWHDGKPFTAEDVKFTLELIVNPTIPRLAHNRPCIVARHHSGLTDRDHVADGAALRAVFVLPYGNLHGSEAHPGR